MNTVSTNDVTSAKKLQELREQQAVIQAYLDGKPIQVSVKGGSVWYDTNCPKWVFECSSYRVKNEPRKFWLVPGVGYFPTDVTANWPYKQVIPVIEVLPEDN